MVWQYIQYGSLLLIPLDYPGYVRKSGSTDSVGGLVGAGKEMMEGSDVMSSFEIMDCAVSGTISGGGEHVDAVVGDPVCAAAIACEGGMTIK